MWRQMKCVKTLVEKIFAEGYWITHLNIISRYEDHEHVKSRRDESTNMVLDSRRPN